MIDIKKLIVNIKQAIYKSTYEGKKIYQCNNFIIKKYIRDDTNDMTFVREHKNEIYKFLDDGYKAAGYSSFKDCSDVKHLVKNFNEIKIAYYENKPIAISVYTGYLKGFKCIGIIATTDEMLHKLGVIATHEIVKIDISLYDKFYWCECSYNIENLYNKYGGIPIPSVYLNCFFDKMPTIIEYDEDEYHYTRLIDNEDAQKMIYGFNSKSTFNTICKEYKRCVLDQIDKIEKSRIIDESVDKDVEDVSISWTKIIIFYEAWLYGYVEHLQKAFDILKNSINALENFIEKYPNKISENKLKLYKLTVENGKEVINSTTLLTYHVFE